MNKNHIKLGAAFSFALMGFLPLSPALAHDRGDGRSYSERRYHDARYDDGRYEDRRYDRGYYESDRGYDRAVYNGGSRYRQRYDRARTPRCDKGSTGLILGAVAGGLLGRAVAGDHGDRTAGLIIGGGAGALAGRAIDRSDGRCRRR